MKLVADNDNYQLTIYYLKTLILYVTFISSFFNWFSIPFIKNLNIYKIFCRYDFLNEPFAFETKLMTDQYMQTFSDFLFQIKIFLFLPHNLENSFEFIYASRPLLLQKIQKWKCNKWYWNLVLYVWGYQGRVIKFWRSRANSRTALTPSLTWNVCYWQGLF